MDHDLPKFDQLELDAQKLILNSRNQDLYWFLFNPNNLPQCVAIINQLNQQKIGDYLIQSFIYFSTLGEFPALKIVNQKETGFYAFITAFNQVLATLEP